MNNNLHELVAETKHVFGIIRRDRAVKLILTHLCLITFVLSVFVPAWFVHAQVLGLITNLVWIWES